MLGTRSVFALQAAAARIGCECGESELEIQTDGVKFRLWVPCGLCGGTHQAEVDVSAILTGRGVGLACPETKQLCCYARRHPASAERHGGSGHPGGKGKV